MEKDYEKVTKYLYKKLQSAHFVNAKETKTSEKKIAAGPSARPVLPPWRWRELLHLVEGDDQTDGTTWMKMLL